MLALADWASPPARARDYGELHYLYAGAVGDQGCAERNPDGPRKRRFVARYAKRVSVADRWFEAHYAHASLAAALTDTYGGPGNIDVRDCLMSTDGKPAFRDTTRFIAKLRFVERRMRSPG